MNKRNLQILSLWLFISGLLVLTTTGFSQTKPDASNTGPQPGVPLTTYSGSNKITVDGTVIEGKIITGGLTIEADNVTIRNCKVIGGLYNIRAINGNSGLLIEYCELTGASSTGLYGGGFTARWLNIHDAVGDGIKPRSNILVEYCYIHHLGYDPGCVYPDCPHGDGVQAHQGGSNMIFRYNNIDMPGGDLRPPGYHHNACFQFTDPVPTSDFIVHDNWLNGGNFTINNTISASHFTNNKFGREYNNGIYSSPVEGPGTWNCNVYEDNGEPIGSCVGGTPTVATPVITPSTGIFTDPPVTVSITCATSGADIRYTLDGSTPTELSTLYSSSFVVDSTTTVKARGYKADMDASFTATSTITITDPVAVTGVSVAPASLDLFIGQAADLTETVVPVEATNKLVIWSSNDTSVATVNSNGLVTAIAEGSATITVTTVDGGYTATSSVSVTQSSFLIEEYFTSGASNFSVIAGGAWSVSDGRYVLSGTGDASAGLLGNISIHNTQIANDFALSTLINITGTTSAWDDAAVVFDYQDANNYCYVSINESNDGNTKGIFKVVNGASTELTDITASISDDTDYTLEIIKTGSSIVVKLDGNQIASATDGTFTGGKVGYGSKNDAGQFDDLQVSVSETVIVPVTDVSLSASSLTLDEGQTSDLDETVLPANATDPSVTWSTSNALVATVDINGLVAAVAEGNATITVTTTDGGYTATCAVTVTNIPPPDGYYCDPVNGSMSNDGSQSAPWSSLEDVINAGKTFANGDVIYLMNGNHGFPVITENNTADVTITKAPGQNPVLFRLKFTGGANHWVVKDVEISTNGARVPVDPPLEHPVYAVYDNTLLTIDGADNILVEDCYINSINDASSWTADDWNYHAWNGLYHQDADGVTIRNCHFKNVNFGLHNANGTSISNTLYEYNTIENYNGDGMRGHGVNTVIQYNVVKNAYSTNGNHCDMIQVVGTTTGLILRGNKFLAWTDPNQPFKIGCQGIGLFDGMYYDFVIENNLVVTDHYNGITLLGAQNCKIINNTVIDLNDNNLYIQIAAHKDDTPSTGNVVRNNLCTAMSNDANIGSVDNNIIMPFADKDNYFTDFANFDFSLKASAPAIDAGSATDAPLLDIDQNVRPAGGGFDVGAYEYNGVIIPVTGFSMTPDNMTLDVEQLGTITPAIAPSDASNQTINWTTSDPLVAVVINGVVIATGEGTATITGTTVDGGFSDVCAVTVNPPTGNYNVALYKNVTATAEDGLNVGGNLVDNNTADASRWSAETYPQSATIDLGLDCDLSSIELYTYQSRAYQYTVEASTDGTNYTQIVDRSANASTTQPIADAVSINARYVKLTVTGADGYTGTWVSINEMVVMGTPSSIGTIQVTGVSVSPITLTLDESQTSQLTETVSPANATDKTVTWSSDNTSVATVDANGLVTAVSAGSAIITVTTNDGGFTASCDVTVNVPIVPVTGVSLVPTALTLEEGECTDLTETVSPANATDKMVTWTSSNTSVAIIDVNGLVCGVSAGTATITVTTIDGGYTATCDVTVNAISVEINLALNKPITVSAYQDDAYGYKPGENLVDGDVSDDARWSASGFPQWAEIDLGENYDLNQIDLYPYLNRAYQYIIEAKPDGGSYTTIVDKSANTESADLLVSPVSVTARYVKITVSGLYGSSSSWVSLSELEVWGTTSATVPVTGVSLSATTLDLNAGQTADLDETVSPVDATDKTVLWSSNNTSVATVDANGLVTAVDCGTATITVTTNDGAYTATCDVTVNVPVTGVTLSDASLTLDEGQTANLTETVSPASACDASVVWSTSDGSVATVNAGGLVTAVGCGTATITVTTNDGAYTATCDVTVNVPVTGVTLSDASLTLDEGQTTNLTETVSPANACDASVVWLTSDASVATVNASGLVTAVTEGTATITVTTNDGGYTANCAVTVSAPSPIWMELTYDDFESGWGNFKDGGGDCNHYTGGIYAHQGNNAGQIQDNQDVYSSFYYTNSIDVQAYTQLKVEFWFYGLGMDDGHDFFVEYSDDGGSSWQIVATFVQGSANDFVNGQFYSVTDGGNFEGVIIEGGSYNFTSNAKIRFRCDGMYNDDQVYIDEVKVSATTSASSSANITLAEQKLSNREAVISIYPNPLNGNILNVKLGGYDEANIVIYDLIGKIVYNQSHSMVEQTELQISVDNLNKGIYIISVNDKQQKLIVE